MPVCNEIVCIKGISTHKLSRNILPMISISYSKVKLAGLLAVNNPNRWHVAPGSTNNSQTSPSTPSLSSQASIGQLSQGSMSPDVQPPARKRIRINSNSSDDTPSAPTSQPILIKPTIQPSTSKGQIRDLDELKRQVDFLEEAFPHIVRHVCAVSKTQ